MNITPILASISGMNGSGLSLDTSDLLNNVLPFLGLVVPGLVVLVIMVFITSRKNRPS